MSDVNEAFSHRPVAGISLGVKIVNGYAIVAATFLRRNADKYSRRTAIRNLRARLNNPRLNTSGKIRYAGSYPVQYGTSARDFIARLREEFKPDPSEETADSLSQTNSRETQSNMIFKDMLPRVAAAASVERKLV